MTEALVRPGERLDDLQRNGLRILQRPGAFCFGMDAVLLADFARLRKRERVADFGTGTGILPLLMSQNEPTATFEAIELQPDMADMAARSVRLNGLESRVNVRCADLREADALLGRASATTVVCNPPYGKRHSTITSADASQRVARHETDCTVAEIARAASRVLKDGGRLVMTFPAPRLLELTDAMCGAGIQPKRLRMVHGKVDKPPYLALVEGMKRVKPSLLWLPPLIEYGADGQVTDEIRRIYHML